MVCFFCIKSLFLKWLTKTFWRSIYYYKANETDCCYVLWILTCVPVVADIAAYPDSVNVLENVENDMRTPDKLIDGISDTTDGCHMWLAPILPGIVGISFCDCRTNNCCEETFVYNLDASTPYVLALSFSLFLSLSSISPLCLSLSFFAFLPPSQLLFYQQTLANVPALYIYCPNSSTLYVLIGWNSWIFIMNWLKSDYLTKRDCQP